MQSEIKQDKIKTLVKLIHQFNETLNELTKIKNQAVKKQCYEESCQLRDLQTELVTFRDNLNHNHIQPFHFEYEQETLSYQDVADHLFAKDSLWKHRTLRTLFDPFSSEYDRTTMNEKALIMKKILSSEYPFEQLIIEYKAYYRSLSKPHVARAFEQGMLALIFKKLDDKD